MHLYPRQSDDERCFSAARGKKLDLKEYAAEAKRGP